MKFRLLTNFTNSMFESAYKLIFSIYYVHENCFSYTYIFCRTDEEPHFLYTDSLYR